MPNETVVELTQEQQVIVNAVIAGVKKEMTHRCVFSESTQVSLDHLADAIEETKATRGTHILILSTAKAWEDVKEKMARAAMWGIIVLVAGVLALFAGKPVWAWIKP